MTQRDYIEFWNPLRIERSKTVPYVRPGSMMKGLFSDNSLVCYKRGSLASGGVGTVRNSTTKGRRT
jgi:hypothetical protein